MADNPVLLSPPAPRAQKPSFSTILTPAPAQPPQPASLTPLWDPKSIRSRVETRVLQALQNIQPYKFGKHTIRLRDVSIVDDDSISHPENQTKAVLLGETIAKRVRGTWEILDENGNVISQTTKTIAKIPYFTNLNSFIFNGTSYSITNQFRLRPGVYVTYDDSGTYAHFNPAPKTGTVFKIRLQPEKERFVIEHQQSITPVYPLLKALGISDDEIKKELGEKIHARLLAESSSSAEEKIVKRFLGDKGNLQALQEEFKRYKFSPHVNAQTVNAPDDTLTGRVVLNALKRILEVHRNPELADDRDHLAFQKVMDPAELMAERIEKDYASMQKKALFKAFHTKQAEDIPIDLFTPQITSVIADSGLARAMEEINPVEIYDRALQFSRLGEGAISNIDSVRDEMRGVNPSYLGFIDPIRTPESAKIGLDSYGAEGIYLGEDGYLYREMINAKTGKKEIVSAKDLVTATIAFPGELESGEPLVAAIQKGRQTLVKPEEVDYVLPHFNYAFSPVANLLPLKSTLHGQRAVMGSRMITQALPLINPEKPLVRNLHPEKKQTYERLLSEVAGTIRAKEDGIVEKVTDDAVTVRYASGETKTYNLFVNHPLARKTPFHQMPTVAPGDKIKKGDLLARSNFTDAEGDIALGINARIAFIPWRGYNFADGFVISESFAKRIASEHMYKNDLDLSPDHKVDKKVYLSFYPTLYKKEQLEKIDENGLAKIGTTVNPGDPLILAVKHDPEAARIHKRKARTYTDQSVVWKHNVPGVVTHAIKTDKGAVVVVKAIAPAEEGDKLADRWGGKGVISKILPDDEMPILPDGKPAEVVQGPLGIISRKNPSSIWETILGKIASKTGQPYELVDFEANKDWQQFIYDEMKKHGVSGVEYVVDPSTGKKIPSVFSGVKFFMRLHQTSESKAKARGFGHYTAFGEPAKGGDEGAKRLAILETNALVAHGAVNVLQDASSVRGQRNEKFWSLYMSGYDPPPPTVPLIFQSYINQLRAAGINVRQQSNRFHIFGMGRKDVDELVGDREIQNAETVRVEKNLKPYPGGLFDERLTGGHNGDRWSYIKLPEPMPNPIMEQPIRILLDLNEDDFLSVLKGEKEINGETGPQAIHNALKRINIDQQIETLKKRLNTVRGSDRDKIVRKLSYLMGAKKANTHPEQWMWDKIPVLPPRFRPINLLPDQSIPLVEDANYLYHVLFKNVEALKTLLPKTNYVHSERANVYTAMKALAGLVSPQDRVLQEKNIKGFLAKIIGDQPKSGYMQNRLLTSQVDLVGLSVIAPDPNFDIDHIGLPENRAWEVYKPFIIRRLRRRGVSLLQAIKEWEERTPMARGAIEEEIKIRPVIVNRAPVLHKFGIMAFWPVIVKGDIVRLNPLLTKGFGADFDGDTMQYHVPVTEKAIQDAVNLMLPSRNVISPATLKTPTTVFDEDYIAGLYLATRPRRDQKEALRFMSKKDAIKAFLQGKITADTIVNVPDV